MQENQYKRIDKVIKLIQSIDNYSNTDYMSEAYLNIVKDKIDIETIDVNSYSLAVEKFSQLRRADNIITEDELARGSKGVCLSNYIEETNEIEEMIEELDIVDEFLDLRELVLKVEGKDLWRLIELTKMGSKATTEDLSSLLKVVSRYKEDAIETVRLVFKEEVYEEIEKILGSSRIEKASLLHITSLMY